MTKHAADPTELDLTLAGFSALAQEIRLKTFQLLMLAGEEGMPAGQISAKLDVTPNKLSAHLNVLTEVGLLNVQRQGRHMIYSANKEAVAELIDRFAKCCCNGERVCKGETV